MCDSQFDSLPWLSLQTDKGACYLLKYSVDDLSLKLMVCDMCYVYEEILTADEAMRRFTSLNKDIEIQMNVLIQELKNIYSSLASNTLHCNISLKDISLIIKASFKLFGDIDVEWQSVLKRSTPEVFHKHFVVPLLALNHNLNSTVTDLTQIIVKKDRQINDYKSQRAKLLVKHFETADFNENEFTNRRCSQDYLEASFDASTSKVNESCLNLAEDRCFRNICENIYRKREKPADIAEGLNVEPIDETQEELRKRKELEEKISNQKPSAKLRKKRLNL